MARRWFRLAEITDALASIGERTWSWIVIVTGASSSATIGAWAASVSEWLDQFGPIAWVLAGFLCAALFLGLVWIVNGIRLGRAKREYIDSRRPLNTFVNPVKDVFQEEKINVSVFEYYPHKYIKNKKFVRCHLIGPSVVSFIGGSLVSPRYHNCEWLKVRDDFDATNVIGFENAIMTECLFVNLTILVQESHAQKLEELMSVPWLNPRGE